GVYLPVEGYDHVAFENHVNVVHRNRAPIKQSEAVQLAEFLNSELVDTYFRMFSGSTQVNASDLRRMRFPHLETPDSTHRTHTLNHPHPTLTRRLWKRAPTGTNGLASVSSPPLLMSLEPSPRWSASSRTLNPLTNPRERSGPGVWWR
ncbi:MAG: hypothetical protein OXB92_04180, partial [Acidimicrobiaceae bacterium]|nr:hypothetical protein [Acidimicrobiaceae bacterium]